MLRPWSRYVSVVLFGGALALNACGGDDDDSTATGGKGGGGGKGGASSGGAASGGAASGGKIGTGGASSGGKVGSGGVAGSSSGGTSAGGSEPGGAGGEPSMGGTTNTGGTTSTGGTTAQGGTSTGGTTGTGGNINTGGTIAGGAGGAGGEAGLAGGEGGFGGEAGGPPHIVLTVTPGATELPLAPGGVNWATVQVSTDSSTPVDVTLTATNPSGATANPTSQVVSVGVGTSTSASVKLSGTDVSTGTGGLSLTASAPNADSVSKTFGLIFSDDMARNTVASSSPFPKAFASSSQSNQPATYAFDASVSTFWVSSGTTAGQGPDPTNPEFIGVDFGAPVAIGSVTMVPRLQRGPTAYVIQVSNDNSNWTAAADVPTAADATITTTLATPANARYLRLHITGSRDPGGPSCPAPCDPRNVQIIALEVRKP
ncbi:MAG: discoidin domain-containing protein [Myxococcota bacterium]